MATKKKVLLKIVGSLEDMHDILKELIFCENAHLNLNVENKSEFNNYFMVHQYESESINQPRYIAVDHNNIHNKCSDCLNKVEELAHGLGVELKIDEKLMFVKHYNFEDAIADLDKIKLLYGKILNDINENEHQIEELKDLRIKIDSIIDKKIQFSKISKLNYFNYEIGTFPIEYITMLKGSYERLSAVVISIGVIKTSGENLYMIIYPKEFKEEIDTLLKSLKWSQLVIPDDLICTVSEMVEQLDDKINILQTEISEYYTSIEQDKDDINKQITKIYNVFILEDKISELKSKVNFSNNSFIIDVLADEEDKVWIEKAIDSVSDEYLISAKTAKEYEN